MPVRPRRRGLPSSRRGVKTLVRLCSCSSSAAVGTVSSFSCRGASPPSLFCSFPTAAALVAWLRILRVAGSCVSAGALRLIPRATGAIEVLACFFAGDDEVVGVSKSFLGRPGPRFAGAADTADDEVWSFLGRPRPRLTGADFSTDCTALTARDANFPLRPFGLWILSVLASWLRRAGSLTLRSLGRWSPDLVLPRCLECGRPLSILDRNVRFSCRCYPCPRLSDVSHRRSVR